MRAVLDHLTQQGLLAREPDGWQLRVPIEAMAVGVPEPVRQMLDARIEGLRPEEQRLLEVASVAGTVFTASVCAAAADQEPEDFEALCETLARQQHLVRASGPPQVLPDGSLAPRYAFVHALYREVCYGRQAPGRRATLHRRLGKRLEVVFATQLQDVAAELAYHFEAGAAWARAITYLRVVAETAGQRYAYREAATTLQHALALLPHLPETPERPQQSLTLHLALGAALLMTEGHAAPEVEHTYTQARALCQQISPTPELVPALFDLWRFYIARPQLHIARELGETLLGLAHPADDPALAVIAHYALGTTWLRLGALSAARRHLEAGVAHSTPAPHRAPGGRMVHELVVACRVNAAQTLWLLGYPEQALVHLREALAGTHELSHPFSRAYVWCWAACVAQFCRDVTAVHAHAEAAGAVAAAHGFLRTLTPGTWGKMRAAGVVATMPGFPLWAAMGRPLHGWALAMQGQGAEGMAQICQGIAIMRATGTALFVPYMCTLRADVAAHLGHPADGLQALTEAHTLVEQHEERWWEAEICRLRGVVLLPQPETTPAAAEAWLQRALAVTRRQEAKSLELRAAMSLSRLWQQQGKEEAHALLAPVYGWFTEGFETADLQEAKALLEELAG